MKELCYIFKIIFFKCCLELFFIFLQRTFLFIFSSSGGPEYEDRNPQWIGAVRGLGPAKMAVRRVVV